MIHIERLFVNRELRTQFQSNDSPGLIDVFVNQHTQDRYLGCFVSNTAAYYGAAVIQRLADHGILLATLHGTAGITVDQLLAAQPNDSVYYELSVDNYLCLTPTQQQLLAERHRLLLHDFIEGGSQLYYSLPKRVRFPQNTKDVVILTGSYEQFDFLGPNVRSVSLPLFAHITVSKFAESNNLPEANWHSMPNQLAMVPVRKAKPERVAVLSKLHQLGQLEHCTWSLILNLGEVDQHSYVKNLSVSAERWRALLGRPDHSDFFNQYKDQLPRVLPGQPADSYGDGMYLNKRWFRSHQWYVACETLMTMHFVTEKTFKGMMLGMPTLTVAKAGFNQQLQELGFVMQGDFDHLSGEERAAAVVDYMLTARPDSAAARHNFELLNNKQFMVELATQPLIGLFYPS